MELISETAILSSSRFSYVSFPLLSAPARPLKLPLSFWLHMPRSLGRCGGPSPFSPGKLILSVQISVHFLFSVSLRFLESHSSEHYFFMEFGIEFSSWLFELPYPATSSLGCIPIQLPLLLFFQSTLFSIVNSTFPLRQNFIRSC